MNQFIHKCNRALSRIFYNGKRITRFERLLLIREPSDTVVTEDGKLKTKEVEI